jgi:hypothetical protein
MLLPMDPMQNLERMIIASCDCINRWNNHPGGKIPSHHWRKLSRTMMTPIANATELLRQIH